jgi:SSS family solute:Na+ symporter
MSIILLAVVVLCTVLWVAVGLTASWQRQHISEDYFLAGRTLPWYAIGLSIAGASCRLEVWLLMVGLAAAYGLAAAALAWGNLLALGALGWVLLPYFYRKKLYGPAEFLERRYSPAARGLFVLLMFPALVLGVLAPALYVGGGVLCELGLGLGVGQSPWTLIACVAVVALIAGISCVYGGLMAGVWAGAVGMVVFLAGGAVLAAAAVHDAGGVTEMLQANSPPRLDWFLGTHPPAPGVPAQWVGPEPALPWTGVLAFVLVLATWQAAVSPVVVQRCLGARSERDAKLGILLAGLLQLVLAAFVVLPGLAAVVHWHSAAGPLDQAARNLVEGVLGRQSLLGALGQGLVVAAALAAVINTVTGALNALSSLWTMDLCQDLLGRNVSEAALVGRGRRSSLAALVVGAVLAPGLLLWEKGVLDFILELAAVIGPPTAVVFLVAFFWPRAHGRAAVATLVVGVLAGLALWVAASLGEEVPAWLAPVLNRAGVCGAVSLVMLVLGTLAIPQNPRELYDPDTTWSLAWSRSPRR